MPSQEDHVGYASRALSSPPPREPGPQPPASPPTPLLELTRLSPQGWRVFAKLESCGLTGSIKDRIALPMIERAEREGRLRAGMAIVEASSGNTAASLAAAAAPRGVRVIALIPSGMAADKLTRLRAYGAEPRDCSALSDGNNPEVRRKLARDMVAAEPDRYCTLDQFANRANVEAHEQGTGREAAEQLAAAGVDRLDFFASGAGTGGSLTGVARALRRSAVGSAVRVVLADPAGSALASMLTSDGRGGGGVEAPDGIGHQVWPPNLDKASLDDALCVTRADALRAVALLRDVEGLLAGPCVGYSIAAILKLAAEETERAGAGVERAPVRTALVLISDRGEPYLSDPAFRAALTTSRVAREHDAPASPEIHVRSVAAADLPHSVIAHTPR